MIKTEVSELKKYFKTDFCVPCQAGILFFAERRPFKKESKKTFSEQNPA